MGQDLTYTAGTSDFEFRISRADWELCTALREHRTSEIDLLFGIGHLGDQVTISSFELLTAAESVLRFISEHKELLPYTYQYRTEISADPRMSVGFNTGGQSGIRLPGEHNCFFTIWVGLNKCRLKGDRLDANGAWVKLPDRDLRDIRQLPTENCGIITIRRRRAKTDLAKALGDIVKFLKSVDATETVKSIG